MGYDLHITRRDHWASDDPAVELGEWLALVEDDPDMRLDGMAETTTADGDTIRVVSEGLAVWTAYSGHEQDGNMAWFDHRDGEVIVKNPDEEIIAKMVEIASVLGARVQGDDGEWYPATDRRTEPEPAAPEHRPKRRWWRRG